MTASELMRAEGGAIASVDDAGTRLKVLDFYPSKSSDEESAAGTFFLPIHSPDGLGWRNVVNHDRSWLSDIDDPRFTAGFKAYHKQEGRRFFAHFPILMSGEPQGFLGLAFRSEREVQHHNSKATQLMAAHAGLLMQVGHRATEGSPSEVISPQPHGMERGFSGKLVRHIDVLIADRQWQHLRTSELAGYAGYSPRQFHAMFVKAFGETPHSWILDRRLSLAFNLLMKKQPISLVAFKLGFADQAHFAKKFREKYGFAPSETMKRIED